MIETYNSLKTFVARRSFILVSLFFFLGEVLVLQIFYKQKIVGVDDPFYLITKDVLINLTGATITAIIVAVLLQMLVPIEKKLETVEALDTHRTRSLHRETLAQSDFWDHNGHFGHWVRIRAMPALAEISRAHRKKTKVRLIILDPRDERVCKLYLEYRDLVSKDYNENEATTLAHIQAELLATIIVGQRYHQDRAHRLNVQIFLNKQFNLIREDINNKVVFRTQVDPMCPAIAYHCPNQPNTYSEFYNIARENFDFTTQFCELVRPISLPTQLSNESVKDYLRSVDMLINDDDIFISDVIKRVNSTETKYKN